MALALKNKAVFLHIPKTGGSWVREVLIALNLEDCEIGYKHAGVYRVAVQPYLSKYWMNRLVETHVTSFLEDCPIYKLPTLFSFVRHPISWYESWYKFQTDPERNWKYSGNQRGPIDWHVCSHISTLGKEGISFNDFMSEVITHVPGFVTRMYHLYTHLGCVILGKQESIRQDLITILKGMNVEFDPDFVLNYPRVNKSPKLEQPIEWDKGILEEVTRLEYAGIKRYGYRT